MHFIDSIDPVRFFFRIRSDLSFKISAMTRPLTPPPPPDARANKPKKKNGFLAVVIPLLFFGGCTGLIFKGMSFFPSSASYSEDWIEEGYEYEEIVYEDQTEQWRPAVMEAAERYGISDHIDELMAILKIESGGRGVDIFQSSESAGLEPNTLNTEESIEQGVSYYALLLSEAEALGVDRASVYQAYNYGKGYLQYVADNGGVQTMPLSENFAKKHSKGKKTTYLNPVAIEANGGWRYAYGNMFYWILIQNELNA